MRFSKILASSALFILLAGCGRQAATNSANNPPAVAPVSNEPTAPKHFTQADFSAQCFPYPTQQIMDQYQQIEHLSGQDAIDAEYHNLANQFPNPGGECPIKAAAQRQQSQNQGSSSGKWIENAPANNMAHYGDALPGGKQ